MCNLSNARLEPDDNYDSLQILGKKCYSEQVETLVTPEGGEIPIGDFEIRAVPDNLAPHTPVADQFVVYEHDQVCLRYIVRFE